MTASPVTACETVGGDGSNVTVVGRDQINRLGAKDLPSALREVPGITISRYNPVGSYGGANGGSVYIRGQGAGRPGSEIGIYSDGAPREAGTWGHPIMDIAPVDFANTLSIFKGPQPQSFAGNFGAIDMETLQRTTPGFETNMDLGYGSFDTLRESLSSGGKIKGFDYFAGVAHTESNGFRPHSDARLDHQFLRLGLDISPKDHLSYIAQHTDNFSRDPGRVEQSAPIRDTFATKTITQVLRLDNHREIANGFALFYVDDGKIRWAQDNLSPGVPGSSDSNWDNYGFRASYDFPVRKFTLTTALDIASEGGKATSRTLSGAIPFAFKERFATIAPYAGARYDADLGGVTITPSAGLRYYENNRFPNETAPCFGLTATWDAVKLFVTHARGIRYPGIYVKGVAANNMDQMKAESLDNTEIGAHWDYSKIISLQTSFFHYNGKNLLQYTSRGLMNAGDMETDGVETSVHVTPREDLSFFAGITHLHPESDNATRAPEWSASGSVSYKAWKYLELNLDTQYVSTQYAYNGRTGTPSASDLELVNRHLVANARASLGLAAISPRLCNGAIYISIENLTDADYQFLPGYPMPGINYFTGINVKF
ncbi:MAG: TonB-dependent receptor plug domain-containing protein [Planctomycetota bacterium]